MRWCIALLAPHLIGDFNCATMAFRPRCGLAVVKLIIPRDVSISGETTCSQEANQVGIPLSINIIVQVHIKQPLVQR